MGNPKPASRARAQVEAAKRDHKRRHDTVDASTVLLAAPRARKRAVKLAQKDAVEETVQAADLESQLNLAKWVDRDIPLKTLKDVIDPKSADEFALLAAALRSGTPLATFRARLARSRRFSERNEARRVASAEHRAKEGYDKTYTIRQINSDNSVTERKVRIKRTGPQVRAHRERQRELEAMPVEQRPTYVSQTTTYLNSSLATGSRRGPAYVRPAGVRSRAEISAQTQAQRVTGPYRGQYRMTIPKSLFSDKALVRMGFPRPRDKPKRAFDFKGPTAEADARAFDKTMMGWLKKWKKGVGPPPLPRKP